jgi:hypothetical protein
MKRTLKIRCDRPMGHAARVWLNDFEVSSFLTGLTLELNVGEVNTVELRILVEDIDIDAETLVALGAHVKEQAA